MSFQELSAKVAERFVHTVVLIDDQAYGQVVHADVASELVEPPPPPGDAPQEPVADVPSAGTKERTAHALDAERIVTSFAKSGLVCAVLRPDAETTGSPVLMAAARSDVVIVDWMMDYDDGAKATSIVTHLLKEPPGRLRLVVVYTGEADHKKIISSLGAATGLAVTKDEHALQSQGRRIVVLKKSQAKYQRRDPLAVTEDELPVRVFEEFAHLSQGLVSNVALEAMTVLRANTHELLGRLASDLDAALLIHRLLIRTPQDVEDFVAEIVGQEVAALLQAFEVGRVANIDAIEKWLQRSNYTLTSFATGLGLTASDLVGLLKDGLEPYLKAHPTLQSKGKQLRASGAKLFYGGEAVDVDANFAHVSSMVHRYGTQPLPRLTLGTVVSRPKPAPSPSGVSTAGSLSAATGARADETTEYFICIQPVCDCIRVTDEATFVFAPAAPATEADSPTVVLKDLVTSGSQTRPVFITLKTRKKIREVKSFAFKPKAGMDFIEAEEISGRYVFNASGDTFTWRGQLKLPHALRLVQLMSADLGRVGLDEYELFRRREG